MRFVNCFPGLNGDFKRKRAQVCKYTLHLIAQSAVAIATAAMLWGVERENVCSAPINQNIEEDIQLVDVSINFRNIISIILAYTLIEIVRAICCIVGFLKQNKKLLIANALLTVNEILGLCALIILHVYRFSYPGKLCSGDY